MSVFDQLVGQQDAVSQLRRAALDARSMLARPVPVGSAPADIASRPAPARGAPADIASPPAPSQAPPAGMTHAWLFTGPPGSGRSVAAKVFAAALQCQVPAAEPGAGPAAQPGPESEPGCGQCRSCRAVASGSHPDVRMLVPDGLSIGVTEMRAVVAGSSRKPSLGRWQVVIISDADRLTEGAWNALLKVIEEPPGRTVFLLCAPSTHPEDVLLTIRSRCRVLSLATPTADAVAQVLVGEQVEPARAAWAAQAAQGHVGRARWLAVDEQARDRRATVLAMPRSLTSMHACFQAADELVRAAEAEARVASATLDTAETEQLKVALGAGGTGKGAAAATRGTAGILKDLEKRQKSRATRLQRDALDRALVELASFYRDVMLVHAGAVGGNGARAAHPDFAADVAGVAGLIDSAGALTRLESVLGCRQAIDLNVKPRIAVEAMMTSLGLPRSESSR